MPILYESTDEVVSLSNVSIKPSMQTRRTGRLQPAEASKWEVTQEWAINSIYLTVDSAFGLIKANVIKACEEKAVSLENIWIVDKWAIYKIFWNEYHIVVRYIIAPLPTLAAPVISAALVAALIALAAIGIIIVIGIWLVTSTVRAIFEWVPAEAKPAVATALLLGISAVAIGGGIWAITKVFPKKPSPAAPPAPPPPIYIR